MEQNKKCDYYRLTRQPFQMDDKNCLGWISTYNLISLFLPTSCEAVQMPAITHTHKQRELGSWNGMECTARVLSSFMHPSRHYAVSGVRLVYLTYEEPTTSPKAVAASCTM